jgi:ribonucleotide reductase beta subunit family protein with ferritin-like domain
MFLGESVDVARYDTMKYPWIDKLTDKQLGFFWRPDEIDLSKDAIDFREKLTDNERHVFTSNLKYQTLLDSVQGRAPTLAFGTICSLPELETWLQTWAFSECFAEGTEVLTTKGWLDLALVEKHHEVAQVDINNLSVSFTPALHKIEKHYQGDMVRYVANNRKQFEQLVTPGHRVAVHSRTSGKGFFVEAGQFTFNAGYKVAVAGMSQSTATFGPLDVLRIATQADGSVKPDKYSGARCGTTPVWFGFSKQRKVERLLEAATACGFAVTVLTDGKAKGNAKAQTRIKVDVPAELGANNWKLFDSWVDLTRHTGEYGQAFLRELALWDGTPTGNKGGICYSTVVKANADTVAAIAALSGWTCRVTVHKDMRKESYKDVHSLSLLPRAYKDGQSISKQLVPYDGMVRCLTVPTGALLVRYNGVVSVSGNCIHSRSYTHILRNVYPNPTEVLDSITITPEILDRAVAVTSEYDKLIDLNSRLQVFGETDQVSHRRQVFKTLASVNILEAIRFYVSFACAWSFNERGLMEGNSKIITFIARDEALHLSGTQLMLKAMMHGDEEDEWQRAAHDCLDDVFRMFDEAVDQEKAWANYLFKDGSIIGLNATILSQYIEYIANTRLKALGFSERYKTERNPLPWTNAYINRDAVQVAPQEVELSNYLTGALNSSVDLQQLQGLSL